jgi:hypothetical protein
MFQHSKKIINIIVSMAAVVMMIGGALTNALAFSGSNFLFSQMSGAEERKRHNLAIEKLQHERDIWNEQRLERIDYVNQKLKEQGHAERTFQNANEAMQEYYLLTGDQMQPEPQLLDFLDEDQKTALQTGELVIVATGVIITGYLTYRFIA